MLNRAVTYRRPNRNELPNATRIAYCTRCGHTQQRVNLPGTCYRYGCNGQLSRRHFGTGNRHDRITADISAVKIECRTGEFSNRVVLTQADLLTVTPQVHETSSGSSVD